MIPEDATHYYQHTYYRLGDGGYTYYFSKGIWRVSASVSNQLLREYGTLINKD